MLQRRTSLLLGSSFALATAWIVPMMVLLAPPRAVAQGAIEKVIETPERRIAGENQGQKGFWLEKEVYTYRYDPWPEQVVKTYQDLFGPKAGRPELEALIGRIHRKELSLEGALAAMRDLKGALDAVDNNPMWHLSDVNPTFGSQAIDFSLLDRHFGPSWQGLHEDKRPILLSLYGSQKTMRETYPAGLTTVHDVKHPITTSAFVELTRLARIVAAMDLSIPLPAHELRGEYLRKKRTYEADGDRYRLPLTRDALLGKMQQIYQMAVNTDSTQRHPSSNDGANVNYNKAPLY